MKKCLGILGCVAGVIVACGTGYFAVIGLHTFLGSVLSPGDVDLVIFSLSAAVSAICAGFIAMILKLLFGWD